MPGSVERRKKCHSPSKSPGHIRKSSVLLKRRYKRSQSRDCMLHAQSVGDLASRKIPVCYTSEAQHESKHCMREKLSSKVCTMFPLDVTDCLKNASDWEAMEIRILDEDKCTVLRPKVSDTQRSEKVLVQPSLYQSDHTIKGSSRSNHNSSRGSSVLKQTVCVEKVHVRNLLHTKREKCGNLGSSRSSEYMPSDNTTLAATLTAGMDSRDYIRISGSNIGLISPRTHSESFSCQSTDTSEPETSPASILRSHRESPASRRINRSLPVTSRQDKEQLEDICNSSESEDCTDEDSEDEISGSSEDGDSGDDDDEDDDDDDDDDELGEEEEGQDSEHGDEEGAASSVSDDSYYNKYCKEEECNNKLKSSCEITAEEKQKEPYSEDSADVSCVSPKNTLGNQPAGNNTPKENIDLISSKSDRQNAVPKQVTPVSRQTYCHDGNKHNKPYARDWSVKRTEHQKSHAPFYIDNEDRSSWVPQGEPALNLNEPSTSLSVSEGKKWDTVTHSQDCFNSSQSVSTATSTTARKTSFFPMPEEEIARYKQIALQILTERKQRALENNQHSQVQPASPQSVAEVQSRQVAKKKRNRPSRKCHRSARSKSKDAKSSQVYQNTGCRASQRAGFWASWRIKNQIEKHRRRFHSADASASTLCRARNTHAVSTSRCHQKSPRQIAHKERNSNLEQPGHFPGIAPVKFGFVKQRTVPHQYGKTQTKRQPSQIAEALKPKQQDTVTGTKVWSASLKAHKPPAKTHSSLVGNIYLTGKKSSGSIPSMMRSTQSHYYLKPSTNIHGGTPRTSNMSAHPVQDVKQRTHYEHGTRFNQVGAKTNMKQPNRVCNAGQSKVYPAFGKEKQTESGCGSLLPEGKEKATTQARDTLVTDAALQSGSLYRSTKNAEAPIQSSYSIDNSESTHKNLPKQSGSPLVDGEDENVNTRNVSSAANNEHEETSGEDFKESHKPRTYFDLLQNILKSPTAKAAQALGTILRKPEAQETTNRACDIPVDQIISSYQTLFDQLYDLSSKNAVNDKPKINKNVMQSLECSQKSTDLKTSTDTDLKTPTNTKLQNTGLTAVIKVPDFPQTNFKSAIVENYVQSSSNNEETRASNLSLDKSGERQALTSLAEGTDKNRPGGKTKENTKPTMHAANQDRSNVRKNITVREMSNVHRNITVQEILNLPKNFTIQAGIRGRTSSSGGMSHFQGRPQGTHDSRHILRSATSDKRSATDNRHENRRSKSSHDSSETRKTTGRQIDHTQTNPAVEVRWNRTLRVASLENNTNHKMPAWSSYCKNSTKGTFNKSATTNAIKRISFSDSSCGIKPKINTFLKTSFSCTRQPAVAAAATSTTVFRINAEESSLHKSKQISENKDLPQKVPVDGKRKSVEQSVTKATHVGLINATGTSVQCMTTIQSNPESSSRLDKFLVHKECTSRIKAHALVTAQASSRLMATDRTKLAVEGEPFMKEISNVARNPTADSESRELCAKNLQINGQYQQVQDHLNSNRRVKCSTESDGSKRAYPAITIFAPQACLNILTPKPSAFFSDRTSGEKEGVKELECVKNVSSINSHQHLPVTVDAEVPTDGPILHVYSNKDTKQYQKSVKEAPDNALQLKNVPTQRRPIRSVVKSNSEQWTPRDETCTRKMQREIPKGVFPERQKQEHFRYGLSASKSTLTQVPCQRDQHALCSTQQCKKVGCTIPPGVFSDVPTDSLKMLTKDKASVTISRPSSPASLLAKAPEVSRNMQTCASSADVERGSVLPREASSRDTDQKIITKLNPRNVNGDQQVTIKNICAQKTKSEVGCPHGEQGCSKSKGTRADRKNCISWSKQHLTKSQEGKDKYFVNSTALRAIFVEPYPPFHRLADKHRCDLEANRRPLAWQKRRCRSAEGFDVKNAASRLFTYGKNKLPAERASPCGAGKPLKNDPHLRPSASNCALYQDTSREKLFDPGQVKHVDPKTEVFVDSKSTSDISRIQHGGDAAGNLLNRTSMPDKWPGSAVNVSASKQETKTSEKWGTPPWKPTVSEDESELSDGSSLQAVRKHIVANTCRMIIRESRNLIVSNLQRPTREDSPQKATPANTKYDHELSEVQPQGGCLQTLMNQAKNQTKDSTNQGVVLLSHETSKVPAGINNDIISDVSMKTRAKNRIRKQSVVSSKSFIEGSRHKLAVTNLHDSPIRLTGEPANGAPDNLCHIQLESASLSKPDMSSHNTTASDVEKDEVKDFGSDINDMSGSSKRAIQGKQHKPAHNGISAQVCQHCPDEDNFHDAEKGRQVLNINTVIPVVKNIHENTQMLLAQQEVINITTEDTDATHHKQIIDGFFQKDVNDRTDVASTCVSENEKVSDQEHSQKREDRENTNTDPRSRDKEQNSEDYGQRRKGKQARNISEQGSSAFCKESENTYDVDIGKEDQDEEEKVNHREQTSDEIWRNNRSRRQKDRSADEHQKHACEALENSIQKRKEDQKKGTDKEFKARQEEHEDDGHDHKFNVLEFVQGSAMQVTKDRIKENAFTRQENVDTWQRSQNLDEKNVDTWQRNQNLDEKNVDTWQRSRHVDEKNVDTWQRSRHVDEKNVDTWQRSRHVDEKNVDTWQRSRHVDEKNVDTWQRSQNLDEKNVDTWQRSRHVDEKNAYLLQRCRNTETRVGDRRQDNIRATEQKNSVADENTIETCGIEKALTIKDIGSENRDEKYNKNMEQEDNRESRTTENEGIDKRHDCRDVWRDRCGTMRKSRSLERKKDISQTNQKVVHVRSESSQQSRRMGRDVAETDLEDTKIRRVKTHGRSVHDKFNDSREESTDTKGTDTSARQIREVQERSRNEALTSGENGVCIVIREQTRKLAETIADTNEQRNIDLDQKGEKHKENETYLKERVAKLEESEMFMGDTDQRQQRADSRPDNRDQMHHTSEDEQDQRSEQKGQCLQETEEPLQQILIDGQETEICINVPERDLCSGVKHTNLAVSLESREQSDTEQESTTTDIQLQETDTESRKTDEVFEENNKNYDRKLTERCAYEDPEDCADLVKEQNTEADPENINNMQEIRSSNEGSHMRHIRHQDCIIEEEGTTRYRNIGKSAHDTPNRSGKYPRFGQKSKEFGLNVRGKAKKVGATVGHSDEDQKSRPYPDRDTNIKYTDRKISRAGYESKDSDEEHSRDTCQDKHRLQLLRNQEHTNSDNEQQRTDSLQEGTDELYISGNINLQSRDTAHINKLNKHEILITAQQKDKLECEEEVCFSEVEKVHPEHAPKPETCGRKTYKDEESDEIHQYLKHTTGSVASTTQTEETCLTALTSPRTPVQTRDQQTEMEENFVLLSKQADRNVIGGTENDLQENRLFHRQEQQTCRTANTGIFLADQRTGHVCSPEELQTHKRSPQYSQESFVPPTYASKRHDMQINSQQERLRGIQQPDQCLVCDISCLCYQPTEMIINMPLSPVAENATVLVQTVSSTDSLSSATGIRCRHSGKQFKSCEAVVKPPSHNHEANVSHLYDGLHQPKRSARKKIWNTDSELLLCNEANVASTNTPTSMQKLPEGNCDVIDLQCSHLSALSHWKPSVATDDIEGPVNKALIDVIPADTSSWNLRTPFTQKTGRCRFAVDLSTCPGQSASSCAMDNDYPGCLFHVKVDELMDAHTRQLQRKETDDETVKDRAYSQLKTEPDDEAYTHYRMRKRTKDDTFSAHTHCRMRNEATHSTITTPTHIELGNELNDDTVSAHTYYIRRKEANGGTINVHAHSQLRNEVKDGTMEANTQHQQQNEPNEVEFQFLVAREQETLLISRHLHNVGDSSGTHGATDFTVICDSSIRFKPAHLCVDSLDNVLDTAFVHWILESKDSRIFETTSIEQADRQTKHTEIETHQTEHTEIETHQTEHTEIETHQTEHTEIETHQTEHTEIETHQTKHTEIETHQTEHTEIETHQTEKVTSHSTTNLEINDPNDTLKCTQAKSCQKNSKGGKAETANEPALPTPQNTLSTRLSLIVKPSEPPSLGNTHKIIQGAPTISSMAGDNCDFYSKHLQQDLHSEMPYTLEDISSPDELHTRTSVATRSPCYVSDEPKPGRGNLFQSKLSAESITATKATLCGVCRSTEKLGKDFQPPGTLLRDLPKSIPPAQTEHDPLQKIHSDGVSVSCTQEAFVQKNTIHSNEERWQACMSTSNSADTRAVSHGTEQSASSCPRPAKSQTAIPRVPRVCLLVSHGGCAVQGERTRQTPAHVSFKDECPLGITSNYQQTKVTNSELEKQDENRIHHKIDELASITDNKRNNNVEEVKRSWKYIEHSGARVNDTVVKPREDVSCPYSECVATTQHELVVPPSNSSNGSVMTSIRQKHANPSPCPLLQHRIVIRTRKEAWNTEYVFPHFLDEIKLRQPGDFLRLSFSGHNKNMTHSIDPEDKESSSVTTSTRNTIQHNSSKSVQTETTQDSSAANHISAVSHTWHGSDQDRAELTAQRSLQTRLSHETSTQTLLKQSDFDDSLRLHQSVIIDKQGQITLLKDSCIGTSDLGTESDGPVLEAGTSKIEELVTLDESCSGVPQVTSTLGCLKSLCSPLSSPSSKTEGIIRRVLTRSPDVKNTHIQLKAMENLELFVKSARERNFSSSEPRTSPPCKPSTHSPACHCKMMSLQDFVISNPVQRALSFKQLNVLEKENSLRDTKMHTDCSESIVTYSKPSTDNTQPSTNNDQMYINVNKQTSPQTGANTLQKQAANIKCLINSASLPNSTPQSCLSASKLHFSGCTQTISTMPATSAINAASDFYQEVTQKALPGDHKVMLIPCRPNATFTILSSQDGNLGQPITEPPRSPNLPVADNEIFKATVATNSDETHHMCISKAEICNVYSAEDRRQALEDLTRMHNAHNETTGPSSVYAASGTEKSQSASFTRSCTNPFLQSDTNPFMPSAPLHKVASCQIKPQLDVQKQPAPPVTSKPNLLLHTKDKQLVFDEGGKIVEDWARFGSNRQDSLASSSCLFKDNTDRPNLSTIGEFISPRTAVSENRCENLGHDSESKSPCKSSWRYVKGEDDLMLFSDASRDADRIKLGETPCPADADLTETSACPLIVLFNAEDPCSATRDEHLCEMPKPDRYVNNIANGGHGDKTLLGQEAGKRRQINPNSENNVEFTKGAASFQKTLVSFTEQSRPVYSSLGNSGALERGYKTSAYSVNNSISENLTSHCLLLKTVHGLQTSSASCLVSDSSEEMLAEEATDVSSSSPSLHSRISQHHSEDGVPCILSNSLSCCQTQANDPAANLNILETVTTLTSKFMDIFNGLKKNFHKSKGKHSRKHPVPNLGRHRHYCYTPISKSGYPYRKSRNETKKPYRTSQQQIVSCHQENHSPMRLPKKHLEVHNQKACNLHKYGRKHQSSAMKKCSNVKSSNTTTSAHSDDYVSTSISSQQKVNFRRRKRRTDKMSDELCMTPHAYTEYRRLPLSSSNSESFQLRAMSSAANTVNEIRSNINESTVSDVKTYSFTTVQAAVDTESTKYPEAAVDTESTKYPEAAVDTESTKYPEAAVDTESTKYPEAAIDTESTKDHIVSHQEMLHAYDTQSPDSYHNYPHVFLPQYPHMYVSVHNGGCYVMPNMPFLSTVFTILDDSCEAYLPDQQTKPPKLVLVDDEVNDQAAVGGDIEADSTAAAVLPNTEKQGAPFLPTTQEQQHKSFSKDTWCKHKIKLDQREPKQLAQSASEHSTKDLRDFKHSRTCNYVRYVDVVPLLPNAAVLEDKCAKQAGTCEVLGEIVRLAEDLENSWKEASLNEPFRNYRNEPKTNRYDTAVFVKSTNYSELSSSSLEYDVARFSTSGYPSLHGHYFIKEDLSSPPKRRSCDHPTRTPGPAGVSISKQSPETGRHVGKDYYELGLEKGCNNVPCTADVPIPSMTFENRFQGYRKETAPYLYHESASTHPKFLTKFKDKPPIDGGASITYSYRGRKEYFNYIFGGGSPLSISSTDCSGERESSTEAEVKAKIKDEKQYPFDDCEPDTYDELGSLCSEMQDTTSKLFQGDVEFGTCKDQTCTYESKSLSLDPTFEAMLAKELAASPHTISNMATQTIPQVKRCTSCSHHYFGATLECSKTKTAKTRLITENQICQLSTEHVNKFPIEQHYLKPVGKNYQRPPGYLQDLDYKNQAAPIWNMGLIALRSAPVTRSCFTQTDRPVPGQESHRPNMVEIRDLMGRCIKSRHFRYYVQHIVDERVRTTLRQNIICTNDCKRIEKTRTVSPLKINKKRQRLLNEACADVNPSVRHTVVQASLPSYTLQDVTNQQAPNTATAKSLLSQKSSNRSTSVKPVLEESHNQEGQLKCQWPCSIQNCMSHRTSDHFRTNNKQLANNLQSENSLPEKINLFLENSKMPSSLDFKQASNDNTTNGIVSRSFPTLATTSKVGLEGKVIKPGNSAVLAGSVQKHRFCGSALLQINKETKEHLTNLKTVQHYSSVCLSEVGVKSPVARTAKVATVINTCDKITAETEHEFENIHLQDQKATNSQLETLVVGADYTNNTQLEESTLTDNTALRLHGQSRYNSRSICELYEPVRARLVSTNCTCSATRDTGAHEISDMSSSSSTNIDYGQLGNIMSAETKLLWKNLTRLEKSYDRCKRCRKQYESILLSNKISGDCEAKTEKLDTACELHSEDWNATRCSNQSTEMADDCAKEKRTSKNEDDVAANTERPTGQSQESVLSCVTDQAFNEVNTSAALQTSNSRRAENRRALFLPSIKDSASRCEDRLNMTTVLKDNTARKPWHVKGKNTAKMIQIFERGQGFFQDNEQQARSRNDNHKAHECSDNEQGHENIYSNQQIHTRIKRSESKKTSNVFLTHTKQQTRSTAFQDKAKLNCQEHVKVSDSINNIEKAQAARSNIKCVPAQKLSSDQCYLASQHTLASTASVTDAQHILAMNAPNSETDEWIQKLVNILHEMQQTFPQIAGTSANSVVTQGQSIQTQEVACLSKEPQMSLLQGTSGKMKELQEANSDVSHKSDLKWQRKTPVGIWSIDHPTEIFEQDHSHVASRSCFTSQMQSNDATADMETSEFQTKKEEQHAQCKDTEPSNLGRTEETSEMVTPNPTQESMTTDRVKEVERSQQRHTDFSWLLKSADVTPHTSPNNCMDENNQASSSLLPAEQFCCYSSHVYDMIVPDGEKQQSPKPISDKPIYASKNYLVSSSSYSYGDSCCRTSLLEQDISMCSDKKTASNTTLSIKTVDIVRKAHSCTSVSNSSRLPDWSQHLCILCYTLLNTRDSESQTQTLFEHLAPAHDTRCKNRSQPGKSPGVTNIAKDIFMTSSGKTQLFESHFSNTRNEAIQFHWPKSEWREVHNRQRNIPLQGKRSSQSQSSEIKDNTSKCRAGLHLNSRIPDCNVQQTFKNSYDDMASAQPQTDVLYLHNAMDQRFTQDSHQTVLKYFSQGSQWKKDRLNELTRESKEYVPNTHCTDGNISSKIQRSSTLKPASTETKQPNRGDNWRHTNRMISVLSEEIPGFGDSYELTMATLNDIKDTSLFSNDKDFVDDVDTSAIRENNIQTDVTDTYSVENNKSHSDNVSTHHSVSGVGIPKVPTKETQDSSGLQDNKCLTENRTVDKSLPFYKNQDRKYNFCKKYATDSATYNISAKRFYSRSQRHKSVSPPSVSLKEYISKESDTICKDTSSCSQDTKTMSAKLDSRNQQTVHLQPFDIPIDIYTVPVHRCTSPQKKRKKKADIPTRTVVISGPVRNISIAVQRHMRSSDQVGVTNILTPTHITSPHLAEGLSPTDRANPQHITVSAYDRKSVPSWRHAMKRMLPFGKRTTSHEKKMHTDLVT